MAKVMAVALDFDGTLADSPRVHRIAREQAYDALAQADERFVKTAERDAVFAIAHCLGTTSIGIEAEVLSRLGIVAPHLSSREEATVREVAGVKGELYRAIATSGLPSNPGAVDFVRDFAQNPDKRVAIVTTASDAEVYPFLRLHGLDDSVSQVITSNFRGGVAPDRLKPHPYQYHQAFRLLGMTGISLNEVVAVEDSPGGITAARSAGSFVIGLATTHDYAELQGAHTIVDDFTGLRQIVLPNVASVR